MGSLDPESQGHFLASLCSPSAAVHHPQEVGLDPAHPAETELGATKLALGDGVAADGRLVGLVNDDRVPVIVSQDVFSGRGPARALLDVQGRRKGHRELRTALRRRSTSDFLRPFPTLRTYFSKIILFLPRPYTVI